MLGAWVALLGELLHARLADTAMGEPRFWTVPPEQHVSQLFLHVGIVAISVCWSAPGLQPTGVLVGSSTLSEKIWGVVMLSFIVGNVAKKLYLGDDRTVDELIDMILPCHVYNMLAVYALLGTTRHARETVCNLLVYCAWMPIMAMVFPDTEGIMKCDTHCSPALRALFVALFWIHHLALAAVPAILAYYVKLGRFILPPVNRGSFAQYVAFANSYIGVSLCAFALLVGQNINYSVWPPPLPPNVEALLGGSYYRVTVGLILSFALGPFMRRVYYPIVAAIVGFATEKLKKH
ncbi:hypothetical protein T492DRAFT_1072020 [Pavlovales sp. CCMP2436]|nr:hypothetical protein T492DRAFT_1072020 [Pavlovales sp. CCMP2436]